MYYSLSQIALRIEEAKKIFYHVIQTTMFWKTLYFLKFIQDLSKVIRLGFCCYARFFLCLGVEKVLYKETTLPSPFPSVF